MFSSEYNSVIFSKMYWVGGGKYENILQKKKNNPPPPVNLLDKKAKQTLLTYICLMDFYWY